MTTTETREKITTTVDGTDLYEGDTFECPYCNADVPAELYDMVPGIDDNEAWEKIAPSHADDCEWVQTRAHRI